MSSAHVTDHALVRWMQRQYGLDVEAMRTELADMTRSTALSMATGCKAGDLWAVIQNGRVVTVLDEKPSNQARVSNQ